ncbi:hypothetical protein [Hyphomicrobium sp. MC1]|uniref:hypothetical protein n=1 Tax=Hyphomicrobium sp. (strain MC1) TaxID=717785 RepID=UPI000213E49D|nr:hypothetical protein [Hyphomicrobium sp. MC1]CCB67716.1 protein of unknown function [Hyphomicrobium sp. MC1]
MSEEILKSIDEAAQRQAKALEEIASALKGIATSQGRVIVELANIRAAAARR